MFEDPLEPLLGIKVESPGIYFCGLMLTLLFGRRFYTPFLPLMLSSSPFSGDFFLAAPNYMEFVLFEDLPAESS